MSNELTRRRAIVSSTDVVEVITEAIPPLEPGEVLVEMSVSGVCGSDKAGVHGEHAFMKPPYYPGHEVVGVVVAAADGVDNVEVGDRVTIEPTLVCGHCKPCCTNARTCCENLQFFGCGYREGGMADVFSVPAARLHIGAQGLHRLPGGAYRALGDASARGAGWPGTSPAGRWPFSAPAPSGY